MAKKVVDGFPYVQNDKSYSCALCGSEIPDGVSVLARNSSAGRLTGVLVTDSDGGVIHECGSKVDEKTGGVNSTGFASLDE